MATCIRPELSPSYCHKKFKCRCDRCVAWKKLSRNTEDKELAKERSRLWRIANPEKSKSNSKDYQERNPEQLFKWQMKKYGITPLEYQELLMKQKGVCAICSKTCIYKLRLSVDHDHKTNKVRGLLCGNCNTGLGKFKDDKLIMQKAIIYLLENGDVY